MGRNWIEVSPELAKKHQLYGVGGWLLVFVVFQIARPLVELGGLNAQALSMGLSLETVLTSDAPVMTWVRWLLAIQIVGALITVGLLLVRSRYFRITSSFVVVLSWPIVVGIAVLIPLPAQGSLMAENTLIWIFQSFVWVAYLNRSERVRVTFEESCIARPIIENPSESCNELIVANTGDGKASIRSVIDDTPRVPTKSWWRSKHGLTAVLLFLLVGEIVALGGGYLVLSERFPTSVVQIEQVVRTKGTYPSMDVPGAIASGYSHREIAEYLAGLHRERIFDRMAVYFGGAALLFACVAVLGAGALVLDVVRDRSTRANAKAKVHRDADHFA